MSLTSPGWSLKAASSNSFCMSPRPKKPLAVVSTLSQADALSNSQIATLPSATAVGLCGCEVGQ